jgi:predicted lysophospholipase L1 biosynthesis ABC-type transport system permease subunit
MTMLIHEGDERPREWQPDWRIWRWVVLAVVVGYAATQASGWIGVLLILVAFAAACKALDEALPYGGGLREHRQ